jgi:type VI secretion system protein ImpH
LSTEKRSNQPAWSQLFREPWSYEFFQAMRVLLSAVSSETRFQPDAEPVSIEAHQDLGFPASDIQSLAPPATAGGKPIMRINFLGLTGPTGVLPAPYTELVMQLEAERSRLELAEPSEPPDSAKRKDLERERHRKLERVSAPVDFLNIFNHRLAMLFYYAWQRYRFPVQFERKPDSDCVREMLLDAVGLGSMPLRKRHAFSDDFFVYYAPLLLMQVRSATALQCLLTDYFSVAVEVEQFVGTWFILDRNSVTRFQDADSESERLGFGVVASDQYWTQESMVRLRIGPMDFTTYCRFLPHGDYFTPLREICRFFSRDELAFEARLILCKEEVPRFEFDRPAGSRIKLGWTTWAKTADFAKDAEDVVISL